MSKRSCYDPCRDSGSRLPGRISSSSPMIEVPIFFKVGIISMARTETLSQDLRGPAFGVLVFYEQGNGGAGGEALEDSG